MMKELIGRCAWLCFRADDQSWYMAATAKGWPLGIKSIVGLRSSAASLIKHNDQQSAAFEIRILHQRTNVPVEPLVDLLQRGMIAASCFSAGLCIIVSVIVDIGHDERIIRECAILKVPLKIRVQRVRDWISAVGGLGSRVQLS